MANGVDFDLTRLKARISEMQGNFSEKNPSFRKALVRISLLLENRMILNIRQQHLIDTGRLLNSIESRIKDKGGDIYEIIAGSFGVPYAAQHEFGLTVTVPGHTRAAHTRTSFGKTVNIGDSFVKTHQRKYDKRPFIKPAFDDSVKDIVSIIRNIAIK